MSLVSWVAGMALNSVDPSGCQKGGGRGGGRVRGNPWPSPFPPGTEPNYPQPSPRTFPRRVDPWAYPYVHPVKPVIFPVNPPIVGEPPIRTQPVIQSNDVCLKPNSRPPDRRRPEDCIRELDDCMALADQAALNCTEESLNGTGFTCATLVAGLRKSCRLSFKSCGPGPKNEDPKDCYCCEVAPPFAPRPGVVTTCEWMAKDDCGGQCCNPNIQPGEYPR